MENKMETWIEIVDSLSDLTFYLEKIDVLANEVLTDYLERIDFKTDRGKATAEYDLDIARVKSQVVCDYISKAEGITEKVLMLSDKARGSLVERSVGEA